MLTNHYKNIALSAIRFLSSLGIFYSLVSISLIIIGASVIALYPNSIFCGILSLIIILLINNLRKDHNFIKLYIKHPQTIYTIDYFIISIPILFSFTYQGNWQFALYYIAIVFLIILFIKNQNVFQGLNIPLNKISSINLIIKSNLRTYSFLFTISIVLFYASIFIEADKPIHSYLYQVLLLFISFLPSISENSWYTKNFKSPIKVITTKLKKVTLNYIWVIVVGIIPFVIHYQTLTEFLLISCAGYLATTNNMLLTYIFKRNKLFLSISQLISMAGIIICIQQYSILFLQTIFLLFSIFISIKILKKRYSW